MPPRAGAASWELSQAARAANSFLLGLYWHQGGPGSPRGAQGWGGSGPAAPQGCPGTGLFSCELPVTHTHVCQGKFGLLAGAACCQAPGEGWDCDLGHLPCLCSAPRLQEQLLVLPVPPSHLLQEPVLLWAPLGTQERP